MFNILDYLWFLVKFFWLVILIAMPINILHSSIRKIREEKMNDELAQAIKQAIQEKNFDVSVVSKEELEKVQKRHAKKD